MGSEGPDRPIRGARTPLRVPDVSRRRAVWPTRLTRRPTRRHVGTKEEALPPPRRSRPGRAARARLGSRMVSYTRIPPRNTSVARLARDRVTGRTCALPRLLGDAYARIRSPAPGTGVASHPQAARDKRIVSERYPERYASQVGGRRKCITAQACRSITIGRRPMLASSNSRGDSPSRSVTQ